MIGSRTPIRHLCPPMAAPPQPTANPRRSRRPSGAGGGTLPPCRRPPRSAAADMLVLLAVGYLAVPCVQLLHRGLSEALAAAGRDLGVPPAAVGCAGAGLLALGAAAVAVVRRAVEGRKCDNPGCLGLRDAPEFDVQIETEEMCAKAGGSSGAGGGVDGTDGGFFELSGDHNRELEAKLKKVAPVNGRAVIVFRARCGCTAGRMVVWGPKKGKKVRK